MRKSVAAVALLASVLVSCRYETSNGVKVESSIEKYIPGDTVVLMGAHIDQIQSTAIFKKLIEGQNLGELDTLTKRTGLDPHKDLKEIFLASNGKDTVMIARANVEDPAKVEAVLIEKGAHRTPVGKYNMVGTNDGAVIFVDKKIAIAGKPEHLRAIIEQKTDDSQKRAVLVQMAKLPQDKHIFAVAIGGFAPMPLPETGNLANLNRIFHSLQTVTMTLDLTNGLSLAAVGICKEEKDAKQLHDTLRGLIGFGRLSTPSDKPELLRFFDGIKVEHGANTVKLNADVSMDMVDYFINLTGHKRPAA